MGPTVVLRARASRALGAAMVVAALLGGAMLLSDGAEAVVRYAGLVALFGLAGWAAFWQPHVEVADGGVSVANTLRTVHVPWPALREVEGRYGLRLVTAYGAVQAWAARAPAGRERARGEESEAAATVRARLAALENAGHLDGARLERGSLQVRWHSGTVALLLAAALAAAAGLFA